MIITKQIIVKHYKTGNKGHFRPFFSYFAILHTIFINIKIALIYHIVDTFSQKSPKKNRKKIIRFNRKVKNSGNLGKMVAF